MRRSTRARRSSGNAQSRRLLAVLGTLAVFGGIVAVTQISSAENLGSGSPRPVAGACVQPSPGAAPPGGRDFTGRSWQHGRWVRNHWGDGQQCRPGAGRGGGSGGSAIACPDVAGQLPEVPRRARAEAERNLSQLQTQIAEADRRLAAEGDRREQFVGWQGGYYVESSLLNEQGLVRGHFHTACRMLDSLDAPPAPQEVPAFFVATEDGGGGAEPDEATTQVPGLPESGIAQCAVRAGDGSHRLPMMERANQTLAFDAVRIQVG
ncbi:hypothetical protein [Micromonospora sp. NPDC005367]|uniref:hypothetical protein n=1 Tax=Micromonospora sp. NPDC005367 TaxID=3155590 RepID=UPI0033AAAF97